VKEDDGWKILVDYNSNENKRIGEKKYIESFDIKNTKTL